MIIDPFELFLWTFRRNEKDVVNLYDALSDIMLLATGGHMLNFGCWGRSSMTPIDAQKNLCNLFAGFADLQSAKNIVDVGSGLSAPAIEWASQFDSEIICININFDQLTRSRDLINAENSKNHIRIQLLNATSTNLPFEKETVDRVLSLESAQHMKPLEDFLMEANRVLKRDGVFALAIPVVSKKTRITKLGILSMTWSSEHYSVDYIKSSLTDAGFDIAEIQKIGPTVYEPLVNYYLENRDSIKNNILSRYPPYVEKILFKSLLKMKQVSQDGIIDYILVKCIKKQNCMEQSLKI